MPHLDSSNSGTVVRQSQPVSCAGGDSGEVDPVLGVGASEGVLVEASAAGHRLHCPVSLEDSLDSLEGLEVDEISGGLLILEVGLLVTSPGQGLIFDKKFRPKQREKSHYQHNKGWN